MTPEGAIAAIRFGLGARPGEIEAASGDPQGWLRAQLRKPGAAKIETAALVTSAEATASLASYFGERRRQADSPEAQERLRQGIAEMRGALVREVIARNTQAATTPAGFAERWVRFWSNHFTVAATRVETISLAGPFEREVIRAHAFGDFASLLKASTLHVAMLFYLDNHRSVGPSTRPARRRGLGLNENLAREVLELHTLGVDGGYTQTDVEELAKALTGWVPAVPPFEREAERQGRTMFAAPIHEPGSRTVLGRNYGSEGETQAPRILDDLARHPSTAAHVAGKLARHFIADAPPAEAVTALERAFLETDGDLVALAETLVGLESAWDPTLQKFKTPDDLLISASRVLPGRAVYGEARKVYQSLAQAPFTAPSPAGWDDTAGAWAGPDAIKKRLEWANRVGREASMRPDDFLEAALGPLAGDGLRLAVARAESRAQGLTLALMGPEFQRR